MPWRHPAYLHLETCVLRRRCWVLQVMIAACDTFRSGAVEQLKTHCGRLGVPLYERGYEKDPAKVAAEAVKAAAREGCDVLLVDTAGGHPNPRPWYPYALMVALPYRGLSVEKVVIRIVLL